MSECECACLAGERASTVNECAASECAVSDCAVSDCAVSDCAVSECAVSECADKSDLLERDLLSEFAFDSTFRPQECFLMANIFFLMQLQNCKIASNIVRIL